jgi:hypothetical protein
MRLQSNLVIRRSIGDSAAITGTIMRIEVGKGRTEDHITAQSALIDIVIEPMGMIDSNENQIRTRRVRSINALNGSGWNITLLTTSGANSES